MLPHQVGAGRARCQPEALGGLRGSGRGEVEVGRGGAVVKEDIADDAADQEKVFPGAGEDWRQAGDDPRLGSRQGGENGCPGCGGHSEPGLTSNLGGGSSVLRREPARR